MLPAGNLSFDQAPPISVPFRFFLTAPFFAMAAGLLMLHAGPALFESRFLPATLAATHLLTLGFMGLIMCGAMMQILPVVAGSPIAHPHAVAWLVHAPLTLGTLALAAGFLGGSTGFIQIAALLLGAGFLVFLGAVIVSLSRARAALHTVNTLWLAVIALAVTLILGLTLAAAYGWGTDTLRPGMRLLHPAWGLAGWIGLLLVGVSYQVVPMFQITPNYPAPMVRWLGLALMAGLVLLTAFHRTPWLPALPIALALALFALATLKLQRQRKRKIPDVTLDFWRLALTCLLLVAAALALWPLLPEPATPRASLFLGLVFLLGFAVSAINGMLYKIVPFLCWFHLQSRYMGKHKVPNMKEMVPDRLARSQLVVHLGAVLALCLAPLLPPLVYPGAAALILSNALLARNLLGAVRRYRETFTAAEAKRDKG